MKSILTVIVLVFFCSNANAMSWPELTILLKKNCPISFPAKVTTTGFESTDSGIIEFVTLGQLNKDQLPSFYKEYMNEAKEVHKEFVVDVYKELGPLSEGGIWKIQFRDFLGRHLQTFTIHLKKIK